MNCDNLAPTGFELWFPLAVVAGILLIGLLLLYAGRRRSGAPAAVLIVLLLAIGVVWGPIVPAAHAATVGCVADPGAGNSLTIAQTSAIDDLAPNVAPALIAGRVTNNGADGTFIKDVVVTVLKVTKAPDAIAGICDTSDYALVAPRMSVSQSLTAGASTTFSGASIGFSDKATNQDACKGATVTLLYSSG